MEQNGIFRTKYGSFRRFFSMLGKANLPYLWIVAYLVISVILTNIGVGTTEYSAALFAGDVGFLTVVLPYLFYQILSLAIGSVSGLVSTLCTARIDRNMRRMLWKQVVHLPLGFFDQNNPKELLSRITTDVSSVSALVMQVFLSIFTTGYSSFAILSRVSSYSGKLMLSLLVVLPINLLITFIMGRMRFGVSDLVNRRNAQLTSVVAERANNLLLIKSMGTEEREQRTGEQSMREHYHANVLNAWITGFATPINAIAGVLQTVIIVLVGRSYYSSGVISLTQWIAYYGFATQLTAIITSYCGYWTSFKNAQGAVDRISQVMEELEENLTQGEDHADVSGAITFEDVAFSYNGKPLFDGLNLTIPAGKITAVLGPSGSGKSTLLNLIDRLYPLNRGKIYIGGRDVTDYSLAGYRKAMEYVTQECVMYAGTIRDNLLHGLDHVPEDAELDQVCDAVGMLEYIQSLPDGYSTLVGESGASLSGGQRQRFAVARALLKRPDCLMLDEATAAMDIKGKDSVWSSIRKVMAGKTVVYVAHDVQTIRNADYLIVLVDGKVDAAGPREQVLAENAYCRSMLDYHPAEEE